MNVTKFSFGQPVADRLLPAKSEGEYHEIGFYSPFFNEEVVKSIILTEGFNSAECIVIRHKNAVSTTVFYEVYASVRNEYTFDFFRIIVNVSNRVSGITKGTFCAKCGMLFTELEHVSNTTGEPICALCADDEYQEYLESLEEEEYV